MPKNLAINTEVKFTFCALAAGGELWLMSASTATKEIEYMDSWT